MDITDLVFAQAAIEIVCGFVSAMFAVIIIISDHQKESAQMTLKMFFITAALFVADALSYLFQGSTRWIGLTRLSNLSVFLLNICLIYFSTRYVYSLLRENHASPSKIYHRIVLCLFCAAVVLLTVNLFTGWMYTFDEANQYHRGWGWYVYTGLLLICLVTVCALILRYRKFLDRMTLLCLMLFELFPLVSIGFQVAFYGISIANLGIGASIVVVMVYYLVKWSHSGEGNQRESALLRRSYDTLILFIIMIVSVSASIVSCVITIWHIADEISVSSSQTIAHTVEDHLENMFLQPITVAETMSKNNQLQELMDRDSQRQDEEEIAAYLESVRSGFNYQMVYAVCGQSGAYYTYDGFVKTVDPEHDPADLWYKRFLSTGKSYALEVDIDEANQWDLSVFVNTAVRNEDGRLLGVCGVGMEMARLLQRLSELEQKHNIHISLTDRQGHFRITSQEVQFGDGLLPTESAQQIGTEEFYHEKLGGTVRLTILMPNLDWYLSVEDLNPDKVNISRILIPNVGIFLVGMFALGVAFCVIAIRERKISGELIEKRKASLFDELTGLKNRWALREDCQQIEDSGRLQEYTVILMDLNGLKSINDTLGHQAGDELITATADCMFRSMNPYGQLYRTGGDEFVAVLNCSGEQLEQSLAEFDRLAATWRGKQIGPISTARGVVNCADFPQLCFNDILNVADRRMYDNKKQFYSSIGKEHRE